MKTSQNVYQFFRSSEDLSTINMSWQELKLKVLSLLNATEIVEALRYSGKAAAEHGAAGLMLRHQVLLKKLMLDEGNGEIVQTQGFNALVHLYLAKIITEQDVEEKASLLSRMPEFSCKMPDFWQQEIQNLVVLASIPGREVAAEQTAYELLSMIYETNAPS